MITLLAVIAVCLLVAVVSWKYRKSSSGTTRPLIGSASIRYVKINTRRLVEGQNLEITVHAQISGQIRDFDLSPNLAIIEFNHLPITEKDDIDADAAARKKQTEMRNDLQALSHPPPDRLTPNVDAFQTAVYQNLAKREVSGFVTGQTRIYLLTFMTWKDDNNTAGSYESCQWLQAMSSANIGLEIAVWHECRP